MITSLKCVALLLCSAMLSQATDFQPKVQQSSIRNMGMFDTFEGTSYLLAITDNKLTRSQDSGATWTDISGIETDSDWYNIDTDPFHKGRAFACTSNSMYISNDYGESWKRSDFSSDDTDVTKVNSPYIMTHPLNEHYLIAQNRVCHSFDSSSQESDEKSRVEPRVQKVCSSYSFLSSNGGETFLKVHPPGSTQVGGRVMFSRCEFGRTEKYSQLGNESDVFCTFDSYSDNLGSDTSTANKLFKTSDFGETVQEIDQFQGQEVIYFQVTRDYIWLTTNREHAEDSTMPHVWYSDDGSSFKELQLPGEGHDQRYSFDLLMSDPTGFLSSKLDLFRTDSRGRYDIREVEGLEGTIHASFYSYERSGIIRPVSKMSLDNGRTWRGLQLEDPEVRMDCKNEGKDGATCPPDNMTVDSWSLVSESESAASSGILVAEGSTSCDVGTTSHPPKSYISRDGGASWSKAFDFALDFAFGDRGNVIFAVPWCREHDSNETLKAYYSLDRGYTWSEYPLEETLDPNIALRASVVSNNLTFTVFVSAESFYDEDLEEDVFDSDDGDIYTNVYVFDFSEVFGGKTCTKSDFEYWYQSEGRCVNGAKYKYRRRKADAQCLVNEPFAASEKIEEPCDCTQEDYECAPMFVRDKNGTCVPNESLLKASGACGGAAETAELVPMRLELGNKCVNPLDIEPVQVACGGSSGQNKDSFEAKF